MEPARRLLPLRAVPVAILIVASCSSSHPTAGLSPGPIDGGGRMDVHASMTPDGDAGPSSEETGPEPGETFASPPARTIAPGTTVPDIRGMDFEDGVMALRVIGMDFGFVVARTSHAPQWTILGQSPAPRAAPPASKRVSMVVSMGRDVAGVAGIGGVACKPEEDDIDEPYCQGKILRY
jgi:hypothetical protein